MKQPYFSTAMITKISLCIALLIVSGFIRFPLPMTPSPVSAQTLVVNLTALILSPMQAFVTIGIFLLMGLVGIPVFGGNGGISSFLGPNGGFIIGFLFAAWAISFANQVLKQVIKNHSIRYIIVTIVVGMPIIYLFGTVFMCLVLQMDVRAALMAAVVPFIIGDIIKCIAASAVALALNRALSRQLS